VSLFFEENHYYYFAAGACRELQDMDQNSEVEAVLLEHVSNDWSC